MFKKLINYTKKFFERDGSPWILLSGGNDTHDKNGFVDAVARVIINGATNGEMRLHNADGSVIAYERKGKEPLLDLMFRPSPFFNEKTFIKICVAQFLTYGNVYILKDARDTRNRPTRLIPIPQTSITVNYDNRLGYPTGYTVHTTGGTTTFALEDIIHIYEPTADKLFEGVGRIKRCKIDADIMNAAKVFNLAFFRNGANPGGIIKFPGAVGEQEKEELKRMFNDQHAGADKAHRTAVITRGGDYVSFKTSHKDMEYGEGLRYHQQQILSIMGVAPAMVGLFEYAPQFNTKEQQKITYENTIIPIMRLFAEAWSEQLVPEFYPEESVYFDYDFSKVKALEPEWNEKAQAAQQFANLWPLNEVRDVLELPFNDVRGGDEPPSPILSAFGLNAPKHDTKSVKRVRYIRPTPAQMKRHKANKLALIAEQGEVMEKSIKSHFSMQADLVRDWVAKNENKLFDYDAVFGDEKTQRDLLLAVKVPALAEIYQAGITFEQDYLQSLAPSKNYKFTDKKAMRDRVQEWAQLYAFKWADSIERTTFERLDKIITLGLDNGMSNLAINNLVLQFFAEEGYEPSMLVPNDNGANISIYDRVKTIVQTETRATISEAQKEAFQSTPFVNGKGWITTMGVADHHEGHLEMDGQEVKVEQDFRNPVTGQFTPAPGQFGVADQDINCLCDMYPVVIDEE